MIVFLLIVTITDSFTTTSNSSKSDYEDIKLGVLKFSFRAIFFPLKSSGISLNRRSSVFIPCRRMIPNVLLFIFETISSIPSLAIIYRFNIP